MVQSKNGKRLKNRLLQYIFEKNIFINCPFDQDYFFLLRPLLFTILYCGYDPRIALESFDSGEIRLDKIKRLIDDSSLSLHDLSRIKSTKKNEFYRLNMPFEIRLDPGCKLYHPDEKYRSKKSLILEKERYAYQNWFSEIGNYTLVIGSTIWDDYNFFYTDFYADRTEKGFNEKDLDKMPIPEFIVYIENWIIKNKKNSHCA